MAAFANRTADGKFHLNEKDGEQPSGFLSLGALRSIEVLHGMWKFLSSKNSLLQRIDKSFSQGHKTVISALQWCSDGYLLSGSYDSTAKIWNDTTGEVLLTCFGDGDGKRAITAVAIHLQFEVLFIGVKTEVQTWCLKNGLFLLKTSISMNEKQEVKSVAINRQGDQMIVTVIHEDPLIVVYGIKREWRRDHLTYVVSLTQLQAIERPHATANCWWAAWSPSGAAFATGAANGSLQLWISNSSNNGLSCGDKYIHHHGRRDAHRSDIWCGTVANDGFLVTGGGDCVATRWNMELHEIKSYIGHTAAIRALAVRTRSDGVVGDWLFTASADTTVRQFDLDTAVCLCVCIHVTGVRCLSINPSIKPSALKFASSNVEIVCGGMDGKLYVWHSAAPWMPQGHEMYAPIAEFSDIDPFDTIVKVVEMFLLAAQILISISLMTAPPLAPTWLNFAPDWLPDWSFEFTKELIPDLVWRIMPSSILVHSKVAVPIKQWIVLVIVTLTALSFSTDFHGRLMAYIGQLNREGRGIKRHWDYGIVIDSESTAHKVAWIIVGILRWLHKLSSGVLYMPLLRELYLLWLQPPQFALLLPARAPLVAVLGLLFVGISTRLATVDNEISALPTIAPTWNPISVLWSRLLQHQKNKHLFLGVFTLDAKSSWLFLMLKSIERVVVTLLIVTAAQASDVKNEAEFKNEEQKLAWIEFSVMMASTVSGFWYPPYVVPMLSKATLTLQVLNVYTLVLFEVNVLIGTASGLFVFMLWSAGLSCAPFIYQAIKL